MKKKMKEGKQQRGITLYVVYEKQKRTLYVKARKEKHFAHHNSGEKVGEKTETEREEMRRKLVF